MDRATFQKIRLAVLGIKLVGLAIYGLIHASGGADTSSMNANYGVAPAVLTVPSFSTNVRVMGPNGWSVVVTDPMTGRITLATVTPAASDPTEAGLDS